MRRSRLPDAERNSRHRLSGCRQNIFRAHENILDEGRGNDAQGDFAVDAAEGEVVDFVAERWNVGALGGVDIDGEDILSVEIEVRRQVEGERRVATFVFAELGAVDPDGGGGHHAFEVDEDVLASGFRGKLEAATVERDELVGLLVEAVPREPDVGVRDGDAVEAASRRNLCRARLRLRCDCSASCGSWAARGVRRSKDSIARWYSRERKVRARHRRELFLFALRIRVDPMSVCSPWNIFLPYNVD